MTENTDGFNQYSIPEEPRYVIHQQRQIVDLEDNQYGTYYRIVTLETWRDEGRFVPDSKEMYKNKEMVFTLLGNPECSDCGENLEIGDRIYCKARQKNKVRENPAYCKNCKKQRLNKKRTARLL